MLENNQYYVDRALGQIFLQYYVNTFDLNIKCFHISKRVTMMCSWREYFDELMVLIQLLRTSFWLSWRKWNRKNWTRIFWRLKDQVMFLYPMSHLHHYQQDQVLYAAIYYFGLLVCLFFLVLSAWNSVYFNPLEDYPFIYFIIGTLQQIFTISAQLPIRSNSYRLTVSAQVGSLPRFLLVCLVPVPLAPLQGSSLPYQGGLVHIVFDHCVRRNDHTS